MIEAAWVQLQSLAARACCHPGRVTCSLRPLASVLRSSISSASTEIACCKGEAGTNGDRSVNAPKQCSHAVASDPRGPACGSVASSVHASSTTPGRAKHAKLSMWPLVSSSPCSPLGSQMNFCAACQEQGGRVQQRKRQG